jgi:hypothetical protein
MSVEYLRKAGLIHGMVFGVVEVKIELKEILADAEWFPMWIYVGCILRELGYPIDNLVSPEVHRAQYFIHDLRQTVRGTDLWTRHCGELFNLVSKFNVSTGYNGQDLVISSTPRKDSVIVSYRLEDH